MPTLHSLLPNNSLKFLIEIQPRVRIEVARPTRQFAQRKSQAHYDLKILFPWVLNMLGLGTYRWAVNHRPILFNYQQRKTLGLAHEPTPNSTQLKLDREDSTDEQPQCLIMILYQLMYKVLQQFRMHSKSRNLESMELMQALFGVKRSGPRSAWIRPIVTNHPL